MALLAVPFRPFSLSSSSMALIPNGVAALARPSMLLEMLRIMALIAGWSTGTDGNSTRIAGPTARAMLRSSPPSSATFIRPRKNAITPMSPMATSTALRAEARMASVTACIWPESAPSRTEIRMMTTKMPLSI